MAQLQNDQNKVSRLFGGWVFSLNSLGTAWIFLIMLLINTDVLMRALFDKPLDGVSEMVAISIVGIVFLQLADAVRVGRLTRSDGFFNNLANKHPRAGAVLDLFFDLCGVVFFTIILVGAIPFFVDAWVGGYFVGTEGIFTFPKWPVRLILVISCITVILVLIAKIINDIGAFRNLDITQKEQGGDE